MKLAMAADGLERQRLIRLIRLATAWQELARTRPSPSSDRIEVKAA